MNEPEFVRLFLNIQKRFHLQQVTSYLPQTRVRLGALGAPLGCTLGEREGSKMREEGDRQSDRHGPGEVGLCRPFVYPRRQGIIEVVLYHTYLDCISGHRC